MFSVNPSGMRQEEWQGNLGIRGICLQDSKLILKDSNKNNIMLGPFEILAASYHTIERLKTILIVHIIISNLIL